ncbi:MAG TPA: HAD-IB family hydrolase [Acidimicrobiales bacterium]|nr:HAD-IB family hydrolase [Acidimicrobiales bacterium]
MSGAAFFDLDRTLLSGASGPVLSAALRDAGVISERSIPGEGFVYRLFDLVGETRPSMILTRQAARFAKGWERARVQAAGEKAADDLAAAVQPFAHPLIDEHRVNGRALVLATTTPDDMIRPLAARLGFDDVVATRYGIDHEGRYDGTIAGEFVWGKGKLAAVRRWAADHDVALEDSWAYSDSFYDHPLLRAVGHPIAVNPDPRLLALATVRRWPVLHLDVPEGVPKVPLLNIEPQRLVQTIVRPEMLPWVRFDIDGVERIPDGPAIVVANHRSYFDPLAIGTTFARRGRAVRFLGKREVFDAPVVGQVARALGGIRVDRATGSDEPLLAAASALASGELVVILPQGTIPRGRAFFDPELTGRWGAARLAALARVPVIPLGLWGTEKVWPRSERAPRIWNVTHPPTVRIRIGEPIELKLRSPAADTRRIMTAISELLPPEARQPHDPTPEDLALTFPPGHDGVDAGETERRPGEDSPQVDSPEVDISRDEPT